MFASSIRYAQPAASLQQLGLLRMRTAPLLSSWSMLPSQQQFSFTRSYRKIVLTRDVENLGFAGEVCFVKPGRAMNNLVPRREALFFTDPKA